jgi:hypothetical protein
MRAGDRGQIPGAYVIARARKGGTRYTGMYLDAVPGPAHACLMADR